MIMIMTQPIRVVVRANTARNLKTSFSIKYFYKLFLPKVLRSAKPTNGSEDACEDCHPNTVGQIEVEGLKDVFKEGAKEDDDNTGHSEQSY